MSWIDRLKEAIYISPSGKRLSFLYENLSIETEKKTTVFVFPDFPGGYVQDQGKGSKRIPMFMILSGENYDIEANEFYEALEETGTGKIEHPIYGTLDVVPTGSIRRRDDLKDAANQAIFQVDFFETTLLTFPVAETDSLSVVNDALNNFQDQASEQFANDLNIETATETINFKDKFLAGIAAVETAFSSIAEAEQSIKSQFTAIVNNIQNNIDDLISTPFDLAFQTIDLYRLPAIVATTFQSKIDAYVNLFEVLLSGEIGVPPFTPTFNNVSKNNLVTLNLLVSSVFEGAAESTLNTDFETKAAAIGFASSLDSVFFTYVDLIDSARQSLNVIDTGEAYQSLLKVIVADASRLVEIAFSLKQERLLIVDRARTIIDLCAELYGTVNDQLDFFIMSNEFTGDELFEIQMGRTVKYYV